MHCSCGKGAHSRAMILSASSRERNGSMAFAGDCGR
jgi:hypothetical protein